MIPKIIHQTWKDNNVPIKFHLYQQKVKELHPDWVYKLWTDVDNQLFVEQKFPDFLDTYNKLPKNIMRADMIRYFIMYKEGGLYLDLDYEMLKKFDLTKYELVLPYNRDKKYGDSYNAIGNCIFASSPYHPFWKIVLDDIKSHKNNYEDFFKTLKSKPYINKNTTLEEAITGPGLLSRIYFKVEKDLSNHLIPDREVFHPINPTSNGEYQDLKSKGISYGIHHCVGTWRDKSLFKKIIKKLKQLLYN